MVRAPVIVPYAVCAMLRGSLHAPCPPPPAGEEPHTGIVAGITPGPITLVTTVEDERLEFQDGACCVLRHAWLAPTRARDEVPLWACCLLLQRDSKAAPPLLCATALPAAPFRPTRRAGHLFRAGGHGRAERQRAPAREELQGARVRIELSIASRVPNMRASTRAHAQPAR